MGPGKGGGKDWKVGSKGGGKVWNAGSKGVGKVRIGRGGAKVDTRIRTNHVGKWEKRKQANLAPKHCTHYKGRQICKGYNDGRCKAWGEKDCPGKRAHVCDVRMPQGHACGQAHPRSAREH